MSLKVQILSPQLTSCVFRGMFNTCTFLLTVVASRRMMSSPGIYIDVALIT